MAKVSAMASRSAIAVPNRPRFVCRRPDPVVSARSYAPAQEQPDIAGNATRKLKHTSGDVKMAGPQLALPAEVQLSRLATQCFRPIGVGGVDGPATVTAELARE